MAPSRLSLLCCLAILHAAASATLPRDAPTQIGSVRLRTGRNLMMEPQDREILNAAKWNSLDDLVEALNKGGNIDAPDYYGFSALHWATFRDSQLAAKELIDRGANVNLQTTNFLWLDGLAVWAGSTPLYIAASLNRFTIAQELLGKGADQWIQSSNSWAPVHRAAELGQVDVLKLLLDDDSRVDTVTDQGETALHIAAFKGEMDAASVLINAGYDKEARNNFGATPLHRGAANFGNDHIVKFLLEAGSDPNSQSDNGWTPLHQAAWTNQEEGVQALIDYGASIEMKDMYGETALTVAAARGASKIVEILLQNGADRWSRSNGGSTAADFICSKVSSCPDQGALVTLLQ